MWRNDERSERSVWKLPSIRNSLEMRCVKVPPCRRAAESAVASAAQRCEMIFMVSSSIVWIETRANEPARVVVETISAKPKLTLTWILPSGKYFHVPPDRYGWSSANFGALLRSHARQVIIRQSLLLGSLSSSPSSVVSRHRSGRSQRSHYRNYYHCYMYTSSSSSSFMTPRRFD